MNAAKLDVDLESLLAKDSIVRILNEEKRKM